MPAPEAVERHYLAQQRQSQAAVLLAQRQWRRLTADLGEWPTLVGPIATILRSAKFGAARAGAAYVPLALAEANVDVPDAPAVRAERLADVAADGRPLDTLLYAAVVRVKDAYARGISAPQALADGGLWLDTLVRSEVADASRGAASVAIAARPRIGWTRMVATPCCQRCAVLAGKVFRWNQGFQRHPNCRCRHTPVDEASPASFTTEVRPDQIRDLTEVQRRAIADGADLGQVINANRGRAANGMTTTEGGTRRGLYRQRSGNQAARLTPEAIYRFASTRTEAIALLRRYGYLL